MDHQGLLFDCGALTACQLPPAHRKAQSLCTDRLVRIRHAILQVTPPRRPAAALLIERGQWSLGKDPL